MKRKNSSVKPKALVDRIKSKKEKSKKGNVTFRILTSVYEEFQENCKKLEIGAGEAVEEFMADFNQSCRKK